MSDLDLCLGRRETAIHGAILLCARDNTPQVIMFSRLFLIGSFSYLQVMRTYIKAYMSLNFGQIPPLTTELSALECLKNRCHRVISVDIDPIFFKLAGNKDMHNIMNEFEFRPDRTTDYGVSCP